MIDNLYIVQAVQVLRSKVHEKQNADPINNTLGHSIQLNDWPVDLMKMGTSKGVDVKNLKFYSRAKIHSRIFTS